MNNKTLKKIVTTKVESFQQWTINYNKNIQSHLLADTQEMIESNVLNAKYNMEKMNEIREQLIEEIIELIEVVKEND